MRPIDRGDVPLDGNGEPIQFIKYQESRGYLLDRIGSYCSYCERGLGGNVAVEYMQPKSLHDGLALTWGNFLLACINCNSIKGDQSINLEEYLWPDKDNTLLAFHYMEGGLITVSIALTPEVKQLAERSIKLTGLDRYPSMDPNTNPERTDTRWRYRRTAYERAMRAKENLTEFDNPPMREQIVDTAVATGFFSVWMSVFQHDADMLLRLIHAFPGTSTNCFDENGVPVNRDGGKV